VIGHDDYVCGRSGQRKSGKKKEEKDNRAPETSHVQEYCNRGAARFIAGLSGM
jgi:hypothetical protein